MCRYAETDMDPSDIVIAIVVQIVLIILNAVFAAAEIAVISVSPAKMEKMADDGNKRAKRIVKLTAMPSQFLSTIQVSITLAALLGSAFAADSFAGPMARAIYDAGWRIDIGVIETLCLVLITLVLSFFSIVFGELVPKRVAMKNAEKVALGLSGILSFVSAVFAPVVWLLTVTSNGILRLFHIKAEDDGEEVTEEEIMLMAETGSEKGFIDEKENEFIQNIFEFKENDVGEVCTHRKDVDFLFEKDSQKQWDETIGESNHTYYPVCGKDMDDVIGVLNTKIYFRLKDKSRENVLNNAVVQPVFVSETLPADDLFYRMKTTREYFAVVLDEYGGINGIVTLHDLLELLVGDLNEKGDTPDYEIVPAGEDKWEIRGLAPFDETVSAVGLNFTGEEENEYETFGGYVCELLGSVPEDGTTAYAETDLFAVEVLEVNEHRIEKMLLTKKKPADAEENGLAGKKEEDKKTGIFGKIRSKEKNRDDFDISVAENEDNGNSGD